jgi:uncharacterized protein (UPF0332 family)
MNSDQLLALAHRLAKASPRKPRHADLRRSISTSYYALFHAMAGLVADCLVGTKSAERSDPAWRHAYRALAHGVAKDACKKAHNYGFPQELLDCADAFLTLQEERHRADYDPFHQPKRIEAQAAARRAEDAIRKLRSAPIKDRRAFAIHLVLKSFAKD